MSRFIDVTVPLSDALPTFPGDPPFELRAVKRLAEGSPYELSVVTMGTHAGTHVDAPRHFLPGGATVDELPLEILNGKVRVVAIPASRHCVDRADLEALDLADDIRILFKTRNSGLLRRRAFAEDFVHLTPEAAAHLVQSGIKLVGIDYLSVEKNGSHDFPAHRELLSAGVIVLEGVDLTDVEPGDYDLTCLPLLVKGGDGAPARTILRRRM